MKNIVTCIDGSSLTQDVMNASTWAAQKLGAPILLLHALEKNQTGVQDLSGTIGISSREHLLTELAELDEKRAKLALEHGQLMLEDAQSQLAALQLDSRTLQRHGSFVESLKDLEVDTRLFIMGKQGTAHTSQGMIGSNLENAARSLHQPLMIVPKAFKTPSRFMLAYDGREIADAALEKIANSPLLKDIPCHLVMVDKGRIGQKEALDKAHELLVYLGFQVTCHSIEGQNIQSSLLKFQSENDIDLIVMGAYAHSKVRQFFVGSNTTKMLTESQVPVIILR